MKDKMVLLVVLFVQVETLSVVAYSNSVVEQMNIVQIVVLKALFGYIDSIHTWTLIALDPSL